MPHLIIDYSANLEAQTDIAALCDHMRRAMLETGIFPEAGIRVRAFAARHYAIANGDPRHGYLDMTVRIGAGRSDGIRATASRALFDAANAFLEPLMTTQPIGLTLTLEELPPETSHKRNTIREALGRG